MSDPKESKPFDALSWARNELRISHAELQIWRERFPLIASGVHEEARASVAPSAGVTAPSEVEG